MRINNNIMAMNTHRQYSVNNNTVSKSTERLSSGLRINRAGDDAAGLAISEKMRAQIRGLQMASKNSEDAISLVQTAEGALTETHSILQRMRELAVQSATDTNDEEVDRVALNAEFAALMEEIDDIAGKTAFNNKKLLDGTFGTTVSVSEGVGTNIYVDDNKVLGISIEGFSAGTYSVEFELPTYADDDSEDPPQYAAGDPISGASYIVKLGSTEIHGVSNLDGAAGSVVLNFGSGRSISIDFGTAIAEDELDGLSLDFTVSGSSAKIQTGANKDENLLISIGDMQVNALGLQDSAVDTQVNANNAIATVNTAINTVSDQRAKLGALQNRLEHKISNLDTSAENLQAAESRIRDLDMAREMTIFTQNSILVQAATAMLAQANAAPQNVLSLLG